MVRTAPWTAAPPHHAMKEVKPILAENLRLGNPIPNGLQYDNQQTGAPYKLDRFGTNLAHFYRLLYLTAAVTCVEACFPCPQCYRFNTAVSLYCTTAYGQKKKATSSDTHLNLPGIKLVVVVVVVVVVTFTQISK